MSNIYLYLMDVIITGSSRLRPVCFWFTPSTHARPLTRHVLILSRATVRRARYVRVQHIIGKHA